MDEDVQFGIGEAIYQLVVKREAVARAGWNGKDMFLYYVDEGKYPAKSEIARKYWGETALVPYQPYIAMKTVQGTVVPWLASQTDILADDWIVVKVD